MTRMKVAVLGLGIMGSGMARQLLAAGFEVAVWNRSADKAQPLADEGARIAASPADAGNGAAIVIAMLADDAVSRAVWTGEDGALAAMHEGAIALDSSTLTGGWVTELAALAEARGVRFLEAPVTGSRDQAAQGALRFLVGGAADVLEAARPVLDAMGSATVHLGPVGSGATVKLANNFLCGVQAASLAEALALFEKRGLNVEQAVSVLTEGAPASPLLKAVSRRMLDRAYDPHFFVPLMAKDLSYAGQALAEAGVPSAIAEAARKRFLDAAAAGHGEQDIASIIEPLR
ncbi:NAD(P)-dependent oxidoreductase [Novosphingobium sp. PhB57]|uniref:NAD(P)-dependent oxidoreductase n=1 Tax=Novosphingobium sp. PhB57 TaxID=2485107 RepID=UPI0010456BCA|nr:NAD(P)-dependent oxidoreductase [Novosphingobium sp. PhB57]